MQTILETLSTPNHFLTTILLSPGPIFEALFIMGIAQLLLNKIPSRKQKVYYLFVSTILYIMLFLLTPENIRALFSPIITFLLIFLIFKATKTKSLIIAVVSLAIIIICEMISITFIRIIFQINPAAYRDVPIFRIPFQFCIYIFYIFFYLIFKKFKSSAKILDSFPKKTKILLILNCILAMLAMVPNLILMANNIKNKWTELYLLFAMFIFFSISIYTVFKSNELEVAKQDLENSKLYNKTLSLLVDNLRTFKHDYNNVIQAIGGYINPSPNIEGLKKYYSDLVKEAHEVNTLTVLNPEVINNPAVFGILANKYYLAKNNDVRISFDIFMDLSNIGMDNYKFTKILGILIDNAIEAAEECNEKVVNVSIKYDSAKKKQLLIVKNTYKNKNIDIGKIYEKSYSTKANNSGIGLWEVKTIVEHNPNLFLDTIKGAKYFIQQLEIGFK